MPNLKRKRTFASRPLRRTKRLRAPMPVKIVKARRRRGPGRRKDGIVPDKKRVHMRYFFEVTQDISVSIKHHTFRANGCFDPDQTGGGHQPRGFDQWKNLYNEYVVTSAKINVHAYSVDSSVPFLLSVRAHSSNVSPDSSEIDIVEMPGNKFSLASSYRDSHKRVSTSVNIAKFLNRKNLADDSDLVAAFTADPTESVNFTVTSVGVGVLASGDVRLVGWIDYSMLLLDPVKVGSS